MPLDLEYLRRHYADLSDEGFRAIDRSGLVQAARDCYDEELARRAPWGNAENSVAPHATAPVADHKEVETKAAAVTEDEPEWLDEAACVGSFVQNPGRDSESSAIDSRDALRAAGIPCCLVTERIVPPPPSPYTEYRVMVPGGENLHAVSVLDREIFNAELEAEWKTHFEELSDEEFRALSLDDLCGGLQDRIDRLKRVYAKEIARRRSA